MSTPLRAGTRDGNACIEARATIYRLLSQVFTYPADQDWALLSQNFIPLMLEAADDIGLDITDELDRLKAHWPHTPDDEFLYEFTKLFINSPLGVVVPLNESVYFGHERLVKTTRTLRVMQAYGEAGFAPRGGFRHLLPDHLTLELEFMATALLNGRDVDLFFQEHVDGWQPRLAQTIIDISDSRFYTIVARILIAFLANEQDRLEQRK